MSLGKRIRKARLEKDLTQKQLAELLNVSDATINRYEKDLRSPDPEMLKKIADILKVSVDYLLGKTDIRNPEILYKAGLREVGEMVSVPIIGTVRAGNYGTIAFSLRARWQNGSKAMNDRLNLIFYTFIKIPSINKKTPPLVGGVGVIRSNIFSFFYCFL